MASKAQQADTSYSYDLKRKLGMPTGSLKVKQHGGDGFVDASP
jgi:hypothetical protein